MPRKIPPAAPEPQPEPTVEPPFYEATEDLWSGGAGAMPVLAYRAGDRVVPDVVEPNGWGGKVRVPDMFTGQLTPPAPEAASTGTAPPPDPGEDNPGTTPPDSEVTAPASNDAGPPATEE